ncbi:MAG: SUMF1/EgtB/PvdO family nonheme iron enzyme [Chthonomonas sp.]|nr:SUMF1/EgtB/PvdO family nonheme iron enzyme [Chthonomonas sp.]
MHPKSALILLFLGSAATSFAQVSNLKSYTETIPKSVVKLDMVAVPAGKDIKAFYIAKTETVWELFDLFLKSGPPSKAYDQTAFAADAIARPSRSYILPDLGWGHNGYPVINSSITNTTMFVRWLASLTGKKYRLPTEAEWEWACRGASSAPWKLDEAAYAKQAWYAKNSADTTHPVAKRAANALGLYDMLGNAGEWAMDAKGEPVLCGPTYLDSFKDSSPTRRQRWNKSWQETDPQIPKSRWWLSDGSFVGFRVVCEP